ncbi:MAG: NADH-quinone oxidoreductase subunit C [Thermoleophilia bacterium]
MPDATGLELVAQRVRDEVGEEAVAGTAYHRERATLEVAPQAVRDVLGYLKERDEEPYPLLMSVHGCDYLPDEPRFGVHYELLDMHEVDRISVRTRVPLDDPHVPSVTPAWPTADHQEREVYDMFGVLFDGHPDLRRILMPEDYEGHPQRRDFPIGGEPILFTHNERDVPGWWK